MLKKYTDLQPVSTPTTETTETWKPFDKLPSSLCELNPFKGMSSNENYKQLASCLEQIRKGENEWPKKFTEFKFKVIGEQPEERRLICLNLMTVVVGVCVYFKRGYLPLLPRLLSTVGFTALFYPFGGALIAPQIYNPILAGDNLNI